MGRHVGLNHGGNRFIEIRVWGNKIAFETSDEISTRDVHEH